LERDVPVDQSRLPPWVRRMVGSKQTLRHRTRWRRVSPTRVTAELDISPISLHVRARRPLRELRDGRRTTLAPEATRGGRPWGRPCPPPRPTQRRPWLARRVR
jgi:hypothetical protein